MKIRNALAYLVFTLIVSICYTSVTLSQTPTSEFAQNQRIAFYRLNRPSGVNRPLGNHFYTSSCQERNSAIKGDGYNLESVMGYVASSQVSGAVPLYRVWLNRGNHFYTVSSDEAQQVAQGSGNRFEGVAAYILTESVLGTRSVTGRT